MLPFIVALAVGFTAGLAGAQTADLVVIGNSIYTVDPARPLAKAIAVAGNRIVAVGDEASISRYIGPATKRIKAGNATIVPGFIDSHAHIEGLGDALEMLDLREAKSVNDVVEAVKTVAASTPRGTWIRGGGWDQTKWPGKEFPDSELLSTVSPDHPVFLKRIDGHAAWANRKALAVAGIVSSTRDPPGGKILRNAEGRPTGILIDQAQSLVSKHIPPSTPEKIRRRLERAAAACARLGLTTVHDAGVGAEDLAAYRKLIEQRKLPLSVYAMIGGAGSLWEEYLKRGPEIGEKLTVRSIKLMADGALGSRGAALAEPYADDPGNKGLSMLDGKEIERIARAALEHGFQVNTHAIGDRANHEALEAYAAVLGPDNSARFRIEHAQVVAPADFDLFRKYAVIASMQATHATSDMRWAEERLGPSRVRGAYAWRRFLSIGVHLANGSDFPVENANPLWGFYAAITRQDHAGEPKGGWMPDQRMTREEALRTWTIEGAYAAFEEKDKGSLIPGKLADFVLLSHDIMKVEPPQILETRVLATVLGGEIVYSELE
jgi:predicted amidohydrolase YtcJ